MNDQAGAGQGQDGQAPALPPAPPVQPPPAPPIGYVLLLGDDVVEEGVDETDTIRQILHWIGFRTDAQKNKIIEEAYESLEVIKVMNEEDVTAMQNDLGRRTGAQRLNISMLKTKRLKASNHWVQDFYRISKEPSIVGLNENSFKAELDRALNRAEIRKSMRKQSKIAAEAASPGPLESEKIWKEWVEKFENHARSILGMNGVPLSYIFRKNEEPDHETVFTDFISQTIACAPLNGEYFDADKLAVFNMLISFTTGQPSGDWIKNTLRYSNGKKSTTVLHNHFSGKSNATRNMANAERLRESLHYKSERSMPFEGFLTKCQKMYNIYEREGGPMSEEAKIRFLFKKVVHTDL